MTYLKIKNRIEYCSGWGPNYSYQLLISAPDNQDPKSQVIVPHLVSASFILNGLHKFHRLALVATFSGCGALLPSHNAYKYELRIPLVIVDRTFREV